MMYKLTPTIKFLIITFIFIYALSNYTLGGILLATLLGFLTTTIIELIYLTQAPKWYEKKYKANKIDAVKLHAPVKAYITWANKLLNVKVTVIGEENIPDDHRYLVIGNHQGLVDITALIEGFKDPISFVAKQELQKAPLISGWMRSMNCLFIDRNNPRQGLKVIKQSVEIVKNGNPMAIFPEGTRSVDGTMIPFKSGSLKLAYKGELTILPITINGTYRFKDLFPRKTRVEITVHKPIQYEEYKEIDAKELTNNVHDIVEAGLKLK